MLYISALTKDRPSNRYLRFLIVGPWKRSVGDLSEKFPFAGRKDSFSGAYGGDLILIKSHWAFSLDIIESLLFRKAPKLFGLWVVNDWPHNILSGLLGKDWLDSHEGQRNFIIILSIDKNNKRMKLPSSIKHSTKCPFEPYFLQFKG
jgi:hypothetical protein